MGDSLTEYTEDLNAIEEYSSRLSPQGLYIAGVAKAKSSTPLAKILKILAFIQAKYEGNKLNDTNKAIIEFHIYQGKIDKATEQLKKFQKTSSKNEEEPPKPQSVQKQEGNSMKIEPESKLSNAQVAEIEQKLLDVIKKLKIEEEEDVLRKRKLQEQKRLEAEREAKEQQEKKNKEEQDRKKKLEALKCGICKEVIPEEEVNPLETCGHLHHKLCLVDYLENSIYEYKFPLVCPSQNCKVEVALADLKSRLTRDQFKTYEENSFKHYIDQNSTDLCSCPNPNCRNMFILDTDQGYYQCPMCKREYCLICRCDYHKGYSCDQWGRNYLNNQQEQYYPGLKLKACPHCRRWVEKEEKTNVMRCQCSYIFCFDCGADTRTCMCKKK
ncbi:unnamed protein product [Blepharisma stoltei]|uniref:RBR-type E3 ubiquitin transferase n=1 Tax=Blepharisma stoltei TaxID=1481888 RepID=A0AAU9K856_9CILI|nr:unnamed protein product [Blepharisma stoltei]